MVSTVFTDHTTIILAAWLNDINNWTYSGTFQGTQIKAPEGTANAPSYSFAAQLGKGIYSPGINLLGFVYAIGNEGLRLGSGGVVATGPYIIGQTIAGANGVFLHRDANEILAQRNTINSQTFRLYNTFTDAANYERVNLAWTANVFQMLSQSAGTGTSRPFQFGTVGASVVEVVVQNSAKWSFRTDGSLFCSTDNVGDIGASAANRPRSLYWGTQALAPDGSTGTPAYSCALAATTGMWFRSGSATINWSIGGTSIMQLAGANSLVLGQSTVLGFSSGAPESVGSDVIIQRDAADVLAQRRSTNAQAFRVYNTFTDASNHERGEFAWSSNVLFVGTNQAGTGTARELRLFTAGNQSITFYTTNTIRWRVNGSGGIDAGTDNTYDIGQLAASRPRSLYLGTSIIIPNTGLTVQDTDASHVLSIVPGSNLTANRQFTLTTGDAARTLTISTDVTLDQGVAVASSPTFAALSLTSNLIVAGATAVQNSQSTSYTLVASDANKHILHPTADNNARTFTIPANASVAYTIGTMLTFVNEINTVTIAINSDTLTFASTGGTGSRTLAASGVATAIKITSTKWIISGTGLT